jgi:hypothetical protein
MGWNDYRQKTAANMKKKTTRRYPPWQAGVLMINAGDEFDVAFCDVSPYPRPHHWTGMPNECTANNPLFDGKCVYCYDAAERDERNDKIVARGGQSERYKHWLHDGVVVPVVDLRMHHFVPDPDKDGKFMVVECAFPDAEIPAGAPAVCSHCASKDPYVAERRFLGIRRWDLDLGSELWQTIIAADHRANQKCMHVYPDGSVCGGKNFLTALICPECGHHFMGSEELHKNAQKAAELREQIVKCPSKNCGFEGKPFAEYTCMNAAKRGTPDCPEHMAVPGTLASGLVRITCRGKTGNDGKVRRSYTVDALLDENRVEALVNRMGIDEQTAKNLLAAKGLDLDRQYLPQRKNPDDEAFTKNGAFDAAAYVEAVLQSQAEELGIPNPYGGSTRSHVPFGNETRSYTGARD